jgi:chemotaxis protein MotB
MRYRSFFWVIAGFLGVMAGCAGTPVKNPCEDIQAQFATLSGKFELAKRENLNLKNELSLYRQSSDIDSKRFLRAADTFVAGLGPNLAAGNVFAGITERGFVVTILVDQLFVSATDILSDEGKAFLDKIAVLIASCFPEDYIYIEGHTDNQSLAVFEWKSDWDFSFARALSVLKYFADHKDIDPLRLSASGFGQYRPRATNETREGRRLNRRIEIVISPQRLKTASPITGAL